MKKPLLQVIEDNYEMRQIIVGEFLERYQVIESANGISGYEQAISETPDVIISDVIMPEMDGITLCNKLKNDFRTSHIPIILLTAKGSDEETLLGLEGGADDYIPKPFNASILKIKVKNLIESRRLLRNHFLQTSYNGEEEKYKTAVIDKKFFEKAYEIVERNISNPDFDTSDFANEIFLSRAQLYRKIHAVSGQTVKEFVRIIRLKKAAHLLTNSGLNVSQVAFEVGFNSVAYFTKSFSEYFHHTPSRFIQLKKGCVV